MNKGRIDRAIEAARRLVAKRTPTTSIDGLPTEWRTLDNGQRVSVYQPSEEEAAGVLDFLLGIGGAHILVGMNPFSGNDANALADMGFERGEDGRWTMDAATERAFLQGWLDAADQSGRQVTERARIERWLVNLGGSVQTQAATATTSPSAAIEPEPYSAPAVDADVEIARRARERDGITEDNLAAWKRAVRSSEPRPHDDIQDALTRRRNRQSR